MSDVLEKAADVKSLDEFDGFVWGLAVQRKALTEDEKAALERKATALGYRDGGEVYRRCVTRIRALRGVSE